MLTSIISDLQVSIAIYEQTKQTPDIFTTDIELHDSDDDNNTYYCQTRRVVEGIERISGREVELAVKKN
jgi:hypothetical protein